MLHVTLLASRICVHTDLKQNYKHTPGKCTSKEVPSAWRHRENNWTEGNLALMVKKVVDRITSKGTSLFLHNTKCEANSVIPFQTFTQNKWTFQQNTPRVYNLPVCEFTCVRRQHRSEGKSSYFTGIMWFASTIKLPLKHLLLSKNFRILFLLTLKSLSVAVI